MLGVNEMFHNNLNKAEMMPAHAGYSAAAFQSHMLYGIPGYGPTGYGMPMGDRHGYPAAPYQLPPQPGDVTDIRTAVSPPPQRERFSYTRYQLELMNGIYTKIRYPNSMQKQLIAKRVGISREQVKIWFQNRRRKEITGKGLKNSAEFEKQPKMVPHDVMQGVLSELSSYENDPKGKKLRQKLIEQTRRMRQSHNSPLSPALSKTSDEDFDHSPTLLSTSGSDHTSPPSSEKSASSPGCSRDIPSPPEIDSSGPAVGQSEVPSNAQLDMPAPPNAVAPQNDGLPEKVAALVSASQNRLASTNNTSPTYHNNVKAEQSRNVVETSPSSSTSEQDANTSPLNPYYQWPAAAQTQTDSTKDQQQFPGQLNEVAYNMFWNNYSYGYNPLAMGGVDNDQSNPNMTENAMQMPTPDGSTSKDANQAFPASTMPNEQGPIFPMPYPEGFPSQKMPMSQGYQPFVFASHPAYYGYDGTQTNFGALQASQKYPANL